ncbi:MAG: preprotein translocase subunit Sec61beta [Methanobacteriota archaeon]
MPKSEERMPATGAGLIRYFQDEGSGLKISPKSVLFFTAATIIFVMFLHIAGSALLGF